MNRRPSGRLFWLLRRFQAHYFQTKSLRSNVRTIIASHCATAGDVLSQRSGEQALGMRHATCKLLLVSDWGATKFSGSSIVHGKRANSLNRSISQVPTLTCMHCLEWSEAKEVRKPVFF